MTEDITIKSDQKGLRIFNKLPDTLLLIAYLLVVRFTGLDMDGITGYIFIGTPPVRAVHPVLQVR